MPSQTLTLEESTIEVSDRLINITPYYDTIASDILLKPLSELGDANPIPAIEEYVNRSEQQRQEEARKQLKHQGRRGSKSQAGVKRPINCFILYMKAWASYVNGRFRDMNRTVPEIVALSWRMERRELKQIYKNLADEEKRNHSKAHKDYQFNSSRRRRQKTRDTAYFQDCSPGSLVPNGFERANQPIPIPPHHDFVLFNDLPSPEDIYGLEGESFPWMPSAELPVVPHSCGDCYYNPPNSDRFIPFFSPEMTTIWG